MKVRRLTRTYGFGGYSIYRYLVSDTSQGEYFLPWCEETARAVASYWNASLEDITRIVDGCVQVGLFNDELYRKHGVLTLPPSSRTTSSYAAWAISRRSSLFLPVDS